MKYLKDSDGLDREVRVSDGVHYQSHGAETGLRSRLATDTIQCWLKLNSLQTFCSCLQKTTIPVQHWDDYRDWPCSVLREVYVSWSSWT